LGKSPAWKKRERWKRVSLEKKVDLDKGGKGALKKWWARFLVMGGGKWHQRREKGSEQRENQTHTHKAQITKIAT